MAKRSKTKLTLMAIGAGIAAAVVALVMYSRKTSSELKEKVFESGKQVYGKGEKVMEPAWKAKSAVAEKVKKEKEEAKGEVKEKVEEVKEEKKKSEAA